MLLSEAIHKFLETVQTEYGYSPHTLRAYRRDLQNFHAFALTQRATTLSTIDIELLRSWLWDRQQRGLATRTLARNVATLKSFGRWLEFRQLLPGNPASRLRAPQTAQTLPRVLGEEQLVRILDRAAEQADDMNPVRVRDYAVLELLYAAALRVSELCSLTLGSIDAQARTLRIMGKGNRERVVPIGAPAAHALQSYLTHARPVLALRATPLATQQTGARNEKVFLGSRGGPLSQTTVYRLVATKLQAEGAGPRGPHTFRHTAATHMLNGGAELRVIQEMLGHTSLASTQIYTHVSTERLTESYRQAHPRA